jgi:hypothetical protein
MYPYSDNPLPEDEMTTYFWNVVYIKYNSDNKQHPT